MSDFNERIKVLEKNLYAFDAMPLLQEMQAEIERLQAENEDLEERIEAAVDILDKDDPNQFSTIIASKFILEHGVVVYEDMQ